MTWDFDLINEVTSLVESQNHTLTNLYDNAGRRVTASHTVPRLSGVQPIQNAYDEAGNRKQLTWPVDGYFVTYTYDALHRTERGCRVGL